jgi:hypothetical protein
MKELEDEIKPLEKQLNELKIMKWICAEWGLRVCMHQDRPITKRCHPYTAWFLDIGLHFRLDGKAAVDSKFIITHDTQNRSSVYEQTNFFRKRVCGFVGVNYFDENRHLQDFLYKKTQYGGERRLDFWKRKNYWEIK